MPAETEALALAQRGDESAFARLVQPYRRELRAHCYRMSASIHDADDLLQDSLLRAWRALDQFEGRSGLRTWLYKVTTSACLDALGKRPARALPSDLGSPMAANAAFGPPRLEPIWIEPCPDEIVDLAQTPEARYSAAESVAFAFLVALQVLPPQQRAVLILRDVLGWQAQDCAELLELSVAAVNSSLQRARDTLQSQKARSPHVVRNLDDIAGRALLARYVQAWERADVPALVSLLHEDATLAMPPLSEWLRGAASIGASLAAMVLPPEARGTLRLLPTGANGLPAFAAYRQDTAGGPFRPMALHVLELEGGEVTAIVAFLDGSLFSSFGLPSELSA